MRSAKVVRRPKNGSLELAEQNAATTTTTTTVNVNVNVNVHVLANFHWHYRTISGEGSEGKAQAGLFCWDPRRPTW